MTTTYIVAWSGGTNYDPPSYAAFATLREAREQRDAWAEQMVVDEGDRIEILQLVHSPHLGLSMDRLDKESR